MQQLCALRRFHGDGSLISSHYMKGGEDAPKLRRKAVLIPSGQKFAVQELERLEGSVLLSMMPYL